MVLDVTDRSRDAELARMADRLETLARYADAQEQRAGQLQRALDSRVVVEQAVGMLAERFDLNVIDAFDLLRRAARDSQRELRALAAETIVTRVTPVEIAAARAAT
jgi:AmiR/NasT family two-component response regulator